MSSVHEEAPVGTGSTFSRRLGLLVAVGLVAVFVLGIFLTEPDQRINPDTGEIIGQFDAVRLLYVHVPTILMAYLAFIVTAVGSFMYLRKKSMAWDILAYSAAEVGVVFTFLGLLTGSIWGRPIWNTWWQWGDVRIMTTLVMFLMYIGYLALRSVEAADPGIQARRAAIVGLIGVLNIPIVNRSVEWWPNRTIHQRSTFLEDKFDGLTFFTLMLALLVFAGLFSWLMMHRFRLGWLQHQRDTEGLDVAISARRAEAEGQFATVAVDGSVVDGSES